MFGLFHTSFDLSFLHSHSHSAYSAHSPPAHFLVLQVLAFVTSYVVFLFHLQSYMYVSQSFFLFRIPHISFPHPSDGTDRVRGPNTSKKKTHRSKKNLQSTVNISPCNPFAQIRVFNPRPKRPLTPSTATTACAASTYPIRVSLTCRYVLRTRRELDTVSEITEATNPMKARRMSFWKTLWAIGSLSSR